MEENQQCDEMASLSEKIVSQTIEFFTETLLFLSSFSSHPLFSIFITFYTLILLYFPQIFLNLIFSPILITTAILLSTLLRLGSNQTLPNLETEHTLPTPHEESPKWVTCGTDTEPESLHQNQNFSESFAQWNVKAPLEVIHEEYEGETGETELKQTEETELKQTEEIQRVGIEGMVSLSLYYPESDTGSSSDDVDLPSNEDRDSPESMCFRWDEEEGGDELIEIVLERTIKRDDLVCFDQVEEDNLIEIDISSPVGM